MKICGIDDAGRGSMIGPLVIAGVSIKKQNLKYLRSIGVRDSKKLTPAMREILYKNCLLYTSPSPRDRSVSRMPSSA